MCEENSELSEFKQKLFEESGIRRRYMPLEWIPKILIEAKELGVIEIIPTTMGDPLLSNHFEIIAYYAKRLNLKLNITHNGTFPRKSVKDWAKIIVPITSDIKISWNGANPQTAEMIMKGINFEESISNLKKFVKYRNSYWKLNAYYCRITLQLTFMTNNMHEVTEIIKLAANMGIDRVKGHHLWVHFNELEKYSFESSLENKSKWNEYVKAAFEAANIFYKPNGDKVKLENFYPFDLNKKNIENEIPEKYHCPFLEKEIWISATGKISPCCAPDKLRDSLGDFGNYPETKIGDVLNSDKYLNLVKHYKQISLCKTCKLIKPNILK